MDSLNSEEAEAVVRAIESAAQVRRGSQFFIWLQSHFRYLVPHDVAVCGAYHRERRALVLEAFNSIVVPPVALDALTDPGSPLFRHVTGAWPTRPGHASRIDLAALSADAAGTERDLLLALGINEIIVHGVSRPQRPNELETFFMLLNRGEPNTEWHIAHLEMLLPHLHVTYLRVQANERELSSAAPPARKPAVVAEVISRREKQILLCVREGKSNQEIGESLGISALTVKNHVQKILRKLEASNRTHAVSRALALGLIGQPDEATADMADRSPRY